MRDVLGLSIGRANLVAAPADRASVTRQSVLTLYPHRVPEVGVPEENPNLVEPGLVLRGFIPGIAESGPLVAPDGSIHHRETLMAEALDALARTVGYRASTVVAVPGHWGQNAVAALRQTLLRKPSLGAGDMPAMLVSDATAALASLYANPGFPTDGVVVLCDFGAGGTSVTLSDAAANFRHIGETVRYPDFSGNRLDDAILHRFQAAFTGAADSDFASTAPPNLLSRRLDECRRAKERLSSATVTVVQAGMPVGGAEVRLSRPEFEAMISEPLDQFVTSVEELLRRHAIPAARLAAVATVGGGACIPLVTERLEQRLHAPVVTTLQPVLSAAIGAAAYAEPRSSAGLPDDAAPTEIDPSAWAVGAAMAAAAESVEDGVQAGTYRALAWSEAESGSAEPLPYIEDDKGIDPVAPTVTAEPDEHAGGTPAAAAVPQPAPAAPARVAPAAPRRGRRVGMSLALTAMAALVTLLVAGIMTAKLSTSHTPTETTTSLAPRPLPKVGRLPPPPPPPPETSTVTVQSTVVVPPRDTNPVTTTSSAPTSTTPRTTSSSPTTSQPTTTSSSPSTYPVYPRVTTTPSTAVLVPPGMGPGAQNFP